MFRVQTFSIFFLLAFPANEVYWTDSWHPFWLHALSVVRSFSSSGIRPPSLLSSPPCPAGLELPFLSQGSASLRHLSSTVTMETQAWPCLTQEPVPVPYSRFCFPETPPWLFPKIPHCWTSSSPLRCVCHPCSCSPYLMPTVFSISCVYPFGRQQALCTHSACQPCGFV